MALRFNGVGAYIPQKRVDDAMPVATSDSETTDRVKRVRRPFATTLLALPMMSPDEPKETVSAARTHTIGWHGIGGKILVMPPLCRIYRLVKSQRAKNWWQILGITLNKSE
jgi:hypothetical protein